MYADTVTSSNLFNDLWGFGSGTTGGLNGTVYCVESTADDGSPGTLRYGIESLSGDTWIVFDPEHFPPATKTTIALSSRLDLDRGNLTIDGRGSYVSLRRIVPSGVCGGGDEVILNRGFENIILTHLDFARTYPFDSTKEDCGDLVTIYNEDPEETHFDNIWINQSDFYDCGDDCVSMAFFSASTRADVTISRNQFLGVNSANEKALMLGIEPYDSDKLYKLAVRAREWASRSITASPCAA